MTINNLRSNTILDRVVTLLEENGGVMTSPNGTVNKSLRTLLEAQYGIYTSTIYMSDVLTTLEKRGFIARTLKNNRVHAVTLKNAKKQTSPVTKKKSEEQELFETILTTAKTVNDLAMLYLSRFGS